MANLICKLQIDLRELNFKCKNKTEHITENRGKLRKTEWNRLILRRATVFKAERKIQLFFLHTHAIFREKIQDIKYK